MAIVLSLLSSLVWGTSDFAGGVLSRRRPSMQVVAWTSSVGAVVMTIVVIGTGGWHGPYEWLPAGMAAGLSGALGLVFYYLALATGTMGVVAPVTSLGVVVPVVVGLLSGESPSAAAIVGVVVAIVGVVLTSGPEFSGAIAARPVLIAGAGGLFFGLFFVLLARGADDSPVLSLWAMRTTVLVVVVVIALVRRSVGSMAGVDYVWITGISCGDLGANMTFAYASTLGFVSITSVLSSLFPVVTVLWARFLLDERLRRIQIAGVGVTMLGVALISAG